MFFHFMEKTGTSESGVTCHCPTGVRRARTSKVSQVLRGRAPCASRDFAALGFPSVITTAVFTSCPLGGVVRKAHKVLEENHRAMLFRRNIFF